MLRLYRDWRQNSPVLTEINCPKIGVVRTLISYSTCYCYYHSLHTVAVPVSVLMTSLLTGLTSVVVTIYLMRQKHKQVCKQQQQQASNEPIVVYDTPVFQLHNTELEMKTNKAYGQIDYK